MNNAELNEIFPDVAENLRVLAEECAEVIQAKEKIMRFGSLSMHMGSTNADSLTKEIGDLLAVIDILISNGVLDPLALDKAKGWKLEKLAKFYGVDKATSCYWRV